MFDSEKYDLLKARTLKAVMERINCSSYHKILDSFV